MLKFVPFITFPSILTSNGVKWHLRRRFYPWWTCDQNSSHSKKQQFFHNLVQNLGRTSPVIWCTSRSHNSHIHIFQQIVFRFAHKHTGPHPSKHISLPTYTWSHIWVQSHTYIILYIIWATQKDCHRVQVRVHSPSPWYGLHKSDIRFPYESKSTQHDMSSNKSDSKSLTKRN